MLATALDKNHYVLFKINNSIIKLVGCVSGYISCSWQMIRLFRPFRKWILQLPNVNHSNIIHP